MEDSKYVIIAEDTDFLRETMSLTLEENGVEVTDCENGQLAIDAIDARQPDLLILDLLMPVKDGYAVLVHIKEKNYNFPVVVLTNVSDDSNQQRCMELGAKEFLIKSNMDEESLWSLAEKYLQ